MKSLKFRKDKIYQIITVIAVILTVAISVYAVISGRQYFNRRGVRQIALEIRQFGPWAPLFLAGLILINTLVPPIPIPIPLIEIVAGSVFGFWPGFILVWLTQIISSVSAFFMSKYISKLFLKKIIKSRFFNFYNRLIKKRRAFAVFVIRATMTAPFNISFLAGISDMPFLNFLGATTLGVITESAFFPYLGTLIVQRVRFRLWYVLIILIILSVLPTVILLISRILPKKNHSKA